MDSYNPESITNFLASIFFLGVAIFLWLLQYIEVWRRRPYDAFTRPRIYLLALLSVVVLTSIPSITYQLIRIQGLDSEFFRAFVTYTGSVFKVAVGLFLLRIWTYRLKKK